MAINPYKELTLARRHKQWSISANNIVDTGTRYGNAREVFLYYKTFLSLLPGATVWKSSNAVSVSTGSSNISTVADVTFAGGGARSWIVFNVAGGQILLSGLTDANQNFGVVWSAGSLFTGGTISADPTTTDTFNFFLSASGNQFGDTRVFVHCGLAADGKSFWFLTTGANRMANGVLLFEGEQASANADFPYVAAGIAPSLVTANVPGFYMKIGGTMVQVSASGLSGFGVTADQRVELGGGYGAFETAMGVNGQPPHLTRVFDFYRVGNLLNQLGDRNSDGSFICLGSQMMVPWSTPHKMRLL